MARHGGPADDDGDGPGDVGRALDELTTASDDERVRRVIESLIHPSAPPVGARTTGAARPSPGAAPRGTDRAADRPLAATDALGLCRADTWRRLLEVEHASAARYGSRTTVVALEVSDIAVIESMLGEAAADRLVGVLADTVRADARAADTFARTGRWRITGLLPHTDGRTADAAIRRIADGFGRRLGEGLPVRLAVGRAEVDPSLGPDATLARAEGAMTDEPRRVAEGGSGAGRADAVAPPHVPDRAAVPGGQAPAAQGQTAAAATSDHAVAGGQAGRPTAASGTPPGPEGREERPRRSVPAVPDSLRVLERLRADGLVTDDEYRKTRRRVLRRL